jgi:two-component system phosphate regulon sensor histidine kinase PhoR
LTGISVEDHGAGITKQEQREVFRKFVRGTAARALNVRGTGIGLAMVDQIVKAHGGHLELTSEPGRGSRFTMWLPTHP